MTSSSVAVEGSVVRVCLTVAGGVVNTPIEIILTTVPELITTTTTDGSAFIPTSAPILPGNQQAESTYTYHCMAQLWPGAIIISYIVPGHFLSCYYE